MSTGWSMPLGSLDRWPEGYERGRPGWPEAVATVPGLPRTANVLELGAGTGKLTRILLSAFDHVVALEPADAMRRVLEGRLRVRSPPTGSTPGPSCCCSTHRCPDPRARHALDLGCGYGAIAITLAHRSPEAVVYAVDVNERAVALCDENAWALGQDHVHAVLVSDDAGRTIPDDVRFDLIWSNPPIRVGKPALPTLLRRWLRRLAPDGRAVLVVQKHLGSDSLQRWLLDEGFAVERLASRAGFRLLDVTWPEPKDPDLA